MIRVAVRDAEGRSWGLTVERAPNESEHEAAHRGACGLLVALFYAHEPCVRPLALSWASPRGGGSLRVV